MKRVAKSGLTAKITHADLMRFLEDCVSSGIIMDHISLEDEITAIVSVDHVFLKELQRIGDSTQAQIQVLRQSGFQTKLREALKRPILIFGIVAAILASAYLPRSVLIVCVEGNQIVSESQIMDAAENAGIFFGASRREIRSEQVKNSLLEQLPQLQWVGVNTMGCIATISVKERSTSIETGQYATLRGIVAERDGIVRTVHATKGNALCTVGQAVKAGELLVSPYTDCGLAIRVTGAEAEVYAETRRTLEIVAPTVSEERGALIDSYRRFSLQIGKKQVKLYKDGGIHDPGCDKIYEKYFLTLPGGFHLPVALVIEQLYVYEQTGVATAQLLLTESMEQCGRDYVIQQMIAGQILSSKLSTEADGAVCRIFGEYQCLEMIGREQQEGTIIKYGKSN